MKRVPGIDQPTQLDRIWLKPPVEFFPTRPDSYLGIHHGFSNLESWATLPAEMKTKNTGKAPEGNLKPPWPKGVSGNPQGRPKGVVSLAARIRNILEGDEPLPKRIVLAIENEGTGVTPEKGEFFVPALKYLTERHDSRWIFGAWFLPDTEKYFASLTEDEASLLLLNLLGIKRIGHQAERILEQIAKSHLALVWDHMTKRLANRLKEKAGKRYEAFPYKFHGLEKQLSRDPKIALLNVRKHFQENKALFRYRGGRLLSTAFPGCPPRFARELEQMVSTGTEADAEFVLAVMENYRGHPATHETLKRVIVRYPSDASKIDYVKISFDNTGVVSGAFGFAEAMREKKEAIRLWLEDARPEARAFAENHMRELDLRIADEQRRAEADLDCESSNSMMITRMTNSSLGLPEGTPEPEFNELADRKAYGGEA